MKITIEVPDSKFTVGQKIKYDNLKVGPFIQIDENNKHIPGCTVITKDRSYRYTIDTIQCDKVLAEYISDTMVKLVRAVIMDNIQVQI